MGDIMLDTPASEAIYYGFDTLSAFANFFCIC